MFLPSTLEASILQFASCFTQPTFQTFGVIVTGWLLGNGRRVRVGHKTCVALWYNSASARPLRIVVVRDPSGRRKDDCFFR